MGFSSVNTLKNIIWVELFSLGICSVKFPILEYSKKLVFIWETMNIWVAHDCNFETIV